MRSSLAPGAGPAGLAGRPVPIWAFAALLAVHALAALALAACATSPAPATVSAGLAPASPIPPSPTPAPSPTPTPRVFDGERALEDVQVLVAFGPRPAGSAALAESAGYITGTLAALGWAVDAQAFELHGLPLRNLVARANVGRGPVVILGAHYDTRPVADRDPLDPAQPYLGANDGASGTAVLLELARTLDLEYIPYEVWLVFFDGEDRGGLDGWDYAEGARRFAADLTVTPAFVIVVDMVGDREQQLPFEENSTPEIREAIWAVAARLGYGEVFLARPGQRITDDHVPFLERGIKAVDIIDFDYPHWHTAEDTADKVSADSLARVGRTLEVYLEQAAPQP